MLVRNRTWKKSKGTARKHLRGRALYWWVEWYAREDRRPGLSSYDYRGGVPILEDPDALDGMLSGGAGVTLGTYGFADLFPPTPEPEQYRFRHAPGGWLKQCQGRRETAVAEERRDKEVHRKRWVDNEEAWDLAWKEGDTSALRPPQLQHYHNAKNSARLEAEKKENAKARRVEIGAALIERRAPKLVMSVQELRDYRREKKKRRLEAERRAKGVPLTVQHLVDLAADGSITSLDNADDRAKPSVTFFAKRPRGN